MAYGSAESTSLSIVETPGLLDPGMAGELGRRAVYAGSFDPLTLGHEWVIRNGATMFDELHVALAIHPAKHYTFSTDERVEIAEQAIDGLPNVTVGHFDGKFTARYARENGYDFLLRGMRNPSDFGDEIVTERFNHDIQEDVLSVYLLCPRELGEISSSAVKGLVGPEGWEEVVGKYVSEFVLDGLIKKHRERIAKLQAVPEPGRTRLQLVRDNVSTLVRRNRGSTKPTS